MKLSVIMPSYNSEKYIEAAIKSLQCQTYKSWDLIVVDDCSSDGTREVVIRLSNGDNRIRLIALEDNSGGAAKPRNVGVKSVSSELVAFMDADDVWHPRKLEVQLRVLADFNADFVSSQCKDFRRDKDITFFPLINFPTKEISYMSERVRNQIPTSSVIMKREIVLRNHFQESRAYCAVEDYDAWLRILKAGSVCVKILLPLVSYRKSERQISRSKVGMLKKVFMVHQAASDVCVIGAYFFTATHLIGAVYSRAMLKRM